MYLCLFIAGFSGMMLELIGTRVIAPFYGTTLFTWAALITITLVFLSIGYFVGGIIAKQEQRKKAFYSSVLLLGLWIALIPIIKNTVLASTNFFGGAIGPIISSLILFALPMLLIGMLLPIAVREKTKVLKEVGEKAGRLYALTTIGSFAGTITTAFVLIPLVNVSTSLFALALILILVSLIYFVKAKKMLVFPVLILFLILFFNVPSATDESVLFSQQSMQGQIKVIEQNDYRCLLIDGAIQSCLEKETQKSKLPYNDFIKLGFFSKPEMDTALLIGLGAGETVNELNKLGLVVEAVEINPAVVKTAKDYFGFEGIAYIEDGRRFIKNTDKKYDYIVLDAFKGHSAAPHLLTMESFLETKKTLNENGLIAVHINVLADEDDEARAIFKTLTKVFKNVFALREEGEFVSVVVLATDSEFFDDVVLKSIGEFINYETEKERYKNIWLKQRFIPVKGNIITDDYNPLELWQLKESMHWRENLFALLGEEIILGENQ